MSYQRRRKLGFRLYHQGLKANLLTFTRNAHDSLQHSTGTYALHSSSIAIPKTRSQPSAQQVVQSRIPPQAFSLLSRSRLFLFAIICKLFPSLFLALLCADDPGVSLLSPLPSLQPRLFHFVLCIYTFTLHFLAEIATYTPCPPSFFRI